MQELSFAVIGYGRMGNLVGQVLKERNIKHSVHDPPKGFDITNKLTNENIGICFTEPSAGYETTKKFLSKGINLVVGTTKFYLKEDGSLNTEMLNEFSKITKQKECRMFFTSNFSIGMNAYFQILSPLARMMSKAGYDVAIEERHHNRKADISGTAKTIGNIIVGEYANKKRFNFGNCERKIEPYEITITSTRVGSVPGTHTVVFDSEVDTIEFTHTVRDPKIFAKGAVDTAYWLIGQKPGLYTINDRLQ